MKKTLLIDMDGTTGKFYESPSHLEEMWTEGFFKNLKPYKRMVSAIKMFTKKHRQENPFMEFLLADASQICLDKLSVIKACDLGKDLLRLFHRSLPVVMPYFVFILRRESP